MNAWFSDWRPLTLHTAQARAKHTPLLLLFCAHNDTHTQDVVRRIATKGGVTLEVLYEHSCHDTLVRKFHLHHSPQCVFMYAAWVYLVPVVSEETLQSALDALKSLIVPPTP